MSARVGVAIAGVVLVLFGVAYCAGQHAGRSSAELEAREDSAKWVASAIKADARAIDTTRRNAIAAVKQDSAARPAAARARGRVRVLNDSQVAIVSPSFPGSHDSTVSAPVTVPAPIVETITKTDTLLAIDSTAIKRLELAVMTITHDDSLRMQHEQLLEHIVDELKPPACGRKCGFSLGVAAGYTMSNPGQIVKAVGWLAKLVHR